ncbi:imidazolonepropionase [Hamadaea tsunoensis]|uniref:imidazolonepropionase n=1 Tax=Hamadaea tsunoensis TaxID=53368 RepID=UPI00041A0CE6|nr:imidazolonepropionase [Hamadaea tsunoensis]
MRSLLITNIGELTTHAEDGVLRDAAILVTDRVQWVGPASRPQCTDEVFDAEGRAVVPGFVDSHAHLVFAGDRAAEFAARMAGQAYTGGGIRTTMAATRAATDEELTANVDRLVTEMRRQGTTTLEIKSGYGLNVPDETRSLRIASGFTEETTFLGAHVVPPDVDRDDYVRLVAGAMTESCAPHATWIDVFCERGAFDVDEAEVILRAGMAADLLPRIHANQLTESGAVGLAVALDAASADHCTHLSDKDVEMLAGSRTVATLLPGAEFSTRSPYPDARRLIDAGATVALATDCNPGSSYTSSMAFCLALAVREMRMTPAEALWSATAGGARALRRSDVGHLGVGAYADLVLLDAPSSLHLAYRPGVPLVHKVLHKGVWVG